MTTLLCIGVLRWTEYQTQQDLTNRFSLWLNRPATSHSLSLGLFEASIVDLKIPNMSNTEFGNDIEIRKLTIEYSPTEVTTGLNRIQKLKVNGLTVHWNGLFGGNIKQLVNGTKARVSKRTSKTHPDDDSQLEIEHIEFVDTTVIIHLGTKDTVVTLPSLTLKDVQGTHQSIFRQIVEQIQIGLQ